MRRAAIADLVVMGTAGALLRDANALGFAGLILLGLGFLRIRRGVAGIVMLGVLALDTVVFMLPAAASNLSHRDDVFDILIPASLAIISFTAVVAATAGVIRRDDTSGAREGPRAGTHEGARAAARTGSRAAPIVAQNAIAIFAISVIAGLLAQRGDAGQAPRPGDVVVRIGGTAFADDTLDAPAGAVTIAATNRDLFWHTFTIASLGVDLGVPIGAQRRITFTAPPGRYRFICRVPGHEAAGMRGTLTLTQGGT